MRKAENKDLCPYSIILVQRTANPPLGSNENMEVETCKAVEEVNKVSKGEGVME